MKCIPFANEWHYGVPVESEMPEAFWVALLNKLPEKGAEQPGEVKSIEK